MLYQKHSKTLKALEEKWRLADWERDVEFFYRYKGYLDKEFSDRFREHVIKRMLDIKARWPRELKNEDIPEL